MSGTNAVQRIYLGDKVGHLWCSDCKTQTPYIFGWYGGHWLTCLVCHPEAETALQKKGEEHGS